MAIIRCQVRLARKTNLPEDTVINTFHMSGTPALATDAVAARFAGFYNLLPSAGALTIRQHLSTEMSTDALANEVRFYDLDEPEPRVPFRTFRWTLGVVSTTALPAEVAFALSFEAIPASGFDQRNRRGRVYLGCLGQNTLEVISNVARPASGFRNTCLFALDTLRDNLNTDGFSLGIWSETNLTFANADRAWVDDAFDTQRRRGASATSKTFQALV